MAVRTSTLQTDALVRHLDYSGAVPDVALFLRRTVEEQAQVMKKLANVVRVFEIGIDELEAKLQDPEPRS